MAHADIKFSFQYHFGLVDTPLFHVQLSGSAMSQMSLIAAYAILIIFQQYLAVKRIPHKSGEVCLS